MTLGNFEIVAARQEKCPLHEGSRGLSQAAFCVEMSRILEEVALLVSFPSTQNLELN
jgi:predicted metal-binding protein